jgi:hypothetical protein
MHTRLELVDPAEPLDFVDDLLGRYVRVCGVDEVDTMVPARHQTGEPGGRAGAVELSGQGGSGRGGGSVDG